MSWLHETSLRSKLIFAIMTTSGVALILVCAVFVVRDFVALRDDTSAQLTVLAKIVGANSASALLFQDVESAEETLGSVLADGSVVCAHLFDAEGHAFSMFHSTGAKVHDHTTRVLGREGTHWTAGTLEVIAAIHQGTERVGTVQLYSRLDEYWKGILFDLGLVGLVLLSALGVALLLSNSFQRVITAPILRLVETMRIVSERKDFSVRAESGGGAETGQLVAGFNEMLQELQVRERERRQHSERLEEEVALRTSELTQTNEDLMAEIAEREKVEAEREYLTDKLMQAARKAGQAEVATGVLHNVGNVLNSVNVTASLLEERLRSPRLEGLEKASEMLREHEGDLTGFLEEDPRGHKLPSYLAQLAAKLRQERDESLAQLVALLRDIDHIKIIVNMQQGYAKGGGPMESLLLSDVVERSLGINANSMERHHIKLTRDFQDSREVETDKHKVIQILVNLFANAVNSLKNNDPKSRHLTVRIEAAGANSSRIRVIDNGVGLTQDGLTKVFQYGYTTREDGHGFGLHSGALAARELGGSLLAASDGPGRGAEFTLELPYRK